MRTTFAVHHERSVINVLAAGQQMLDLIESGTMFADDPDRQQKAVDAADNLESCIAIVNTEALVDSPFLAYRTQILGDYTTAHRLQDLTLHLWNSHLPVNLSALMLNADETHRRIALRMIAGYSAHGENDPHFMRLADEIRDRRAAQKARAEELAAEEHY